MPIRAQLRVAAYVLAFFVAASALVWAVHALSGPTWLVGLTVGIVLLVAVLLVDAFYPRVNLFIPAVVRLPDAGDGRIALTFDDGPVEPYTGEILDILRRYGVKASFFCIGVNVQRHPELARRIVDEGHTLGNHTYSHRNLMLAGAGTIDHEVDRAQQAIADATGHRPVFFRCPKGYKSPLVAWRLRRRGLRLVGYGYPIWDVENPPHTDLVQRVAERARPGDVIVMHDGFVAGKPGRRDALVKALPEIIDTLLARGIRPVTLDEALPD